MSCKGRGWGGGRLAERQTDSGGLNGRPEKLQDVCYSWWCLSALSLLGRTHWIDRAKLSAFILYSQVIPSAWAVARRTEILRNSL